MEGKKIWYKILKQYIQKKNKKKKMIAKECHDKDRKVDIKIINFIILVTFYNFNGINWKRFIFGNLL